MKLPFLKNKHWPRIGKKPGESRYGFSEDEELLESSLAEFMRAYEAGDAKALHDALEAIVHIILNQEESPDAQPHADA